jgi:hypothetical protein
MRAMAVAVTLAPALIVGGAALMLGCGLAGAATILEFDARSSFHRPRSPAFIDREKDVAAGLGVRWRRWLAMRIAAVLLAVTLGVITGAWVVTLLFGIVAVFGLRFAVAGRASARRLRIERAFLAEIRRLRDRMAVGNQSLDIALQETGLAADGELRHVLAPLARGGSVLDNIVACGLRARSPIVDQACCVLIWGRTRSLDALIDTIDTVLLPVGEAQLALQEESMVTLAQQRAVTVAMAALMGFMFIAVIRVDAFRSFYASPSGALVLAVAGALFVALVAAVGRIAAVPRWTRWRLQRVAALERGVT